MTQDNKDNNNTPEYLGKDDGYEWLKEYPIIALDGLEIKVKLHTDDNKFKELKQSDWIDLCAAEDVEMFQGELKFISLGFSMKLPDGYEAHVVPRSSTYKKWHIIQANSMGVIDNSYCGNDDIWKFPAIAMKDTNIEKGDRICQFRIVKKQPQVYFTFVDDLKSENRGGFGSTGHK